MSENIKVSIKNLYKVFGPDPLGAMEHVTSAEGSSQPNLKQWLLREHGHVLGLNNINIDMPEKKLQVIMGLSGSGKSTLIRHINRLIEPTVGQVVIDGQDVLQMSMDDMRRFRQNNLAMVFQKFALLPHQTVIDNTAYGLLLQGIPRAEARKRAQRWVERVGLGGFEKQYPSQLSGGQQQRVGLARALTMDTDILLMDEAFSALDPLIRTDMQDVLLDLQEELNKTIIFITHDLDEALRIGDDIAILRDGALVQQGSPQSIILDPADEYVSDFIMDVNRGRVLYARSVMDEGATGGEVQIPETMVLEEALQLMKGDPSAAATVVDKSGKPIGALNFRKMIDAMKRPGKETASGNVYG